MQFKINKSILQKGLQIVSPVVSATAPIPFMSNIHLDCSAEGLVLTGTNGDATIRHKITASDETGLKCCAEGTALVPGSYFMDSVKAISKDDLQITIDGKTCAIKAGRGITRIRCETEAKFADIKFETDSPFQMKKSELSEIIEKTVFAVSQNESRPVLTGVNFAIENGTLTCTATDSYRLSRVTQLVPFETGVNATVSGKALGFVKKVLLSGDDEVSIVLTDKSATFFDNTTIVQTTLMAGAYPNTSKLVPSTFTCNLTVNRKEMIDLLKRGMFIKTDKYSMYRLELSNEECTISNRNSEIGEFNETLDSAAFDGEKFTVTVNGEYLADALNALDGDTVTFRFTEPLRPFIITDPENESVLELALPVRTWN